MALVRSLAGAHREQGVLVNALCPSFADTAIITGIKPFLEEAAFPILEVPEVVDAFVAILDGEGTGESWFVVPGTREPALRVPRRPRAGRVGT